jgi:hypothetical protein
LGEIEGLGGGKVGGCVEEDICTGVVSVIGIVVLLVTIIVGLTKSGGPADVRTELGSEIPSSGSVALCWESDQPGP